MDRQLWWWTLFDLSVLLITLPFLIGLLLKAVLFFASGKIRKNALDELDLESEVLSEGQKKVVLAVVGNSTASLTAASTLVTSLVTFLVAALKYQQRWIWILWGLDLVLSCILWPYIRRRRKPYQRVFGLKAGTFILLLSCFLDTFGLIPTIIAARDKATGNCVTMIVTEKVEELAERVEAFSPFRAGPPLSSYLVLSPRATQTVTSSITGQTTYPPRLCARGRETSMSPIDGAAGGPEVLNLGKVQVDRQVGPLPMFTTWITITWSSGVSATLPFGISLHPLQRTEALTGLNLSLS